MTSIEPARHDLERVETVGARAYRACCTCGWRSITATSAGVAGALHDDHVAAVADEG